MKLYYTIYHAVVNVFWCFVVNENQQEEVKVMIVPRRNLKNPARKRKESIKRKGMQANIS